MGYTERLIANRAFQWVICSCKPLTTNELLTAVYQDIEDDTVQLLIDPDEDLLLEYCHNLLVIDPNRGVWIPSHPSVIEYCENHLWSQKQANSCVASVCLLLLMNGPSGLDQERIWGTDSRERDSSDNHRLESFTHYVSHHWMIHVQRSEGEGVDGRLSDLLKRFLGSPTDSSPAYQKWCAGISQDSEEPQSLFFFGNSGFIHADLEPASSASFAICTFGFYTTLPGWWDDPWEEYQHTNARGRSLIQLAATAGCVPICACLIRWGSKVNAQFQDKYYSNALVDAAFEGNMEVVQLLVDSGADVNTQFRTGDYGSALAAAVRWRNIEAVKLLLKSDADVNAQLQASQYGNALAAAVYGGNKEVVELLLKSGANVNAQLRAGNYSSALAAAARWRNKEVVELLLKSGADVASDGKVRQRTSSGDSGGQ